ncbi:DNA-binding protein [Glaciimonas sp. Gout2]|uniref:DNA-binding protein n=1 Tax=unclassified Glaciimonas TaxID=2644401 RepID=UPI002AB4C4E5|nr:MULTISPECIES: DNA-binding protein [unclassified Glaciimonas]MDY7548236.1 DNA-binding protein [Glaciimonas sp. CA11.2]MEB0010614.1 DNA-binding protein [Glaciimonas sp. Cout2]MEB0084750.1 DNA-binding protein [Glaciimonas sp. Gout2]
MGRIGILYADVIQAADKLIAEGKNPTVDGVREELGSTGSKSTIAPLLKRWKAEHQENRASAEVGMPSNLIDAMKSVYDNLQSDVEQRITQAQEAHQKELEAMGETLQRQLEENAIAAETNRQLKDDAARAQQVFEQLRAEQRALNLTLATAQAENTGLQNRLADRAAEIVTMNQQLGYARTQFEHYQEATTIQRAEERSVFEQKLMRGEQELVNIRQQSSDQQLRLAQQEAQLAQIPTLLDEVQRLQETARAERQQAAIVKDEHSQLTYQIQQLTTDRAELKQTLEIALQSLSDVRLQCAIEEKEKWLLDKRIAESEVKMEQLREEKSGLLQERATLQAQALTTAMHTHAGPK